MTNKTLPKLDSHNMNWPTDWNNVFERSAPIILEIGFGLGHFLEYLQSKHPDKNIFGIEISNFCLVKAEKLVVRRGWDNVRVAFARAETTLNHLFEPESISEIYINFPDPWFKERHSGRRLMQRDTLEAMVSRLKPGGKLYLATDIIAYAEMSHEILSKTAGLNNLLESAWVTEWEDRIVTKYEKKARNAGRDCYYFAYTRNENPVNHLPVIKELDMPHIVIETPITMETIFDRFEQAEYRDDDIRVKLLNAYIREHTILFEAFVHEPTIDQLVAILYVHKRDQAGLYTLKLSPIGNPRPTKGVHFAVKMLGEWIIRLSDETQVIQYNVKS